MPIQSITNPFYNPEEQWEIDINLIVPKASKNDEKHIKSRTIKNYSTKNNISKYSTNTLFRKNHNIKQPRGSIRHGSSR